MSNEKITATEAFEEWRPHKSLLEAMRRVATEELGESCEVEVRHDPGYAFRPVVVFKLRFGCAVELIPATNIQSAMHNDDQCRAACSKLRLVISDYMKGIGK